MSSQYWALCGPEDCPEDTVSHRETDMAGSSRSSGSSRAGDLTTPQYWGAAQAGVVLTPEKLAAVGVRDATSYQCDIREFSPPTPYDVACSFGLVEHVSDPMSMLSEHNRLLRRGGLMVVIVPNFRNVQFLYHWLFDRLDLLRHDLVGPRWRIRSLVAGLCAVRSCRWQTVCRWRER